IVNVHFICHSIPERALLNIRILVLQWSKQKNPASFLVMTDMNKECPYCAEDVKAAARICPFCRNWLNVWSLRNPAIFLVIVSILILILIAGFVVSLNRLLNRGRDFSPYRNSLSAVESRMNFQPDKDGLEAFVVVLLTNKCEVAWKDPLMDVRFYDRTG